MTPTAAEFDRLFDAAAALLCDGDRLDADALGVTVSDAYAASGRLPDEWTAAETAGALGSLAGLLDTDFGGTPANALAAECRALADAFHDFTPTLTPPPMPRTLRFPFRLAAGPALVSVETFEGRHTVTSAVCRRTRRNLPMTAADLDAVEARLDTPRTVAVEALDVLTGCPARFVVSHIGGAVFAVRYADGPVSGLAVRPGGEQFTETAEAFAIDRALANMEAEADARHVLRAD